MQANMEASSHRRSVVVLALLAAALPLLIPGCNGGKNGKTPIRAPAIALGTCWVGSETFRNVSETWCDEHDGTWQPNLLAATVSDRTLVDSIPLASWQPLICGDSTHLTLDVQPDRWIEWKIAWIAIDSATARANWDSIGYHMAIDDSIVHMPDSLQWVTEPVSITCAARPLNGVLMGPVVYLAPLTRDRNITMTYTFAADVNDGWTTFLRGDSARFRVTLHPGT